MSSPTVSNPVGATAEPPHAKSALTLGTLWEALAMMPKDALVTRIKVAPTFVVPKRSVFETGPSSSLGDIDPDAFEGAAVITIYEDRHNFVTASETAAGIAPLMRRQSNLRLVSGGNAVTGLTAVSRLVAGEPVIPSKLCPGSAAASGAIIKATEALVHLVHLGKMDDASVIGAIEPALPDGVHICLYRVGDRVFETSDLARAFPRLMAQQRTEIFVEVDRPAGPRTGVHGRLSMRVAPADITYDMLAAAFGPARSALDHLRNVATGGGTVAAARDPACPQ